MRHLNRSRIVRRMRAMKRAVLVLAVLAMAAGTARAEHMASLDPRIALAVELDNLVPPNDPPTAMRMRLPGVDRATTGDRAWRVIDATMLITSTLALAVDWRQTRSAAADGWRTTYEAGIAAMAVGQIPSRRAVDGYFATAALINLGLWVVLPRRWRSAVPAAIIGIEAPAIVGNLSTTRL